jgi:hypothetical protein
MGDSKLGWVALRESGNIRKGYEDVRNGSGN